MRSLAASRTVATVTAIVPLALADVATALTANLRMIRRIAEIYGGRAGSLGSLRLARTVMTSLTLLIALIPLLFFGPASLFGLTICIVLGIFVGTYSSIYMAAPILVWLKVTSDSFVAKESDVDRQERLARERG